MVLNRWSEDYEVESYCHFENYEGQKFYSPSVKRWKTNLTVIEYNGSLWKSEDISEASE